MKGGNILATEGLCNEDCETCPLQDVCPLEHYVPIGDIVAVHAVVARGMLVMMPEKGPMELHYMINTAFGGTENDVVMFDEEF